MDFRAIASGSAGNCYELNARSNAPLLVECGLRFSEIQVALGFAVTSLCGCLITHAHGDHARAAADLSKSGVDLYATAETFEALRIESHRAHVIKPNVSFSVGDFTVVPFQTVHESGSVGFVIDDRHDRMLFLTDSAYNPADLHGLRFDIVAVEANYDPDIIRSGALDRSIDMARYRHTLGGHMSIGTCIAMLKTLDLSWCREIHLLHLSNDNSNAEEFKRRVVEATGVPTFIAPETTRT